MPTRCNTPWQSTYLQPWATDGLLPVTVGPRFTAPLGEISMITLKGVYVVSNTFLFAWF